ncbi:baseplate assembly protein [Brevibacillus panacihumi]|uniref:Baseplate J/gp47 family protein n=1 Tax=Brevibacillus panacihumi TaxID=497735 RepID=A0A3M8C8Z9_9BACL|nr:baseplate J/gp47 family protein [Brevibacillus panacihumi]RNB72184.1 baseplate J/gp47 family protein [Brevibacillus panacihumi]
MARFNLPDITFANKSVEQIETEVLSRYEKEANVNLAPADPRRKLLQAIVILLAQQRSLIDYSAKMNLLSYAEDPFLDHLGALTNTWRLQAQPAKATMRFLFSINNMQTIPLGTRVTPGNGLFFAVEQEVTVQPGQTQVDVLVVCMEAGTMGNGYLPGQINQLVDPLPWVQSVTNISASEGGSDIESPDSYANRIRLAPESFSVAGPDGAYEFWAKTASPLIADVSVRSPSPGVVEIRPLLKDGIIPGQEILDQVWATCSDKTVRPLTDMVKVLAPEVVSFDISVTYWIASSSAGSLQEAIEKAVQSYVMWQKTKLGRDINPSELTRLMVNAGAKRVEIASPTFMRLESYQVAEAANVTVNYGGLEDD